MSEDFFFDILMIGFSAVSIFIFVLLFFLTAPYGQHIVNNKGFNTKAGQRFVKIKINDKLGWFLMEIPTVVIYFILYIVGGRFFQIVPITFMIIFMTHYIQRTFIFPFLLRGQHEMPISIMLMGMAFNGLNTYLQARWINTISAPYLIGWLITPQFIIGTIIFFIGFIINLHSDKIIRTLRKPGDNDFHVPYGGMFKWISCPSYFGEITEWIGWAILTWSYPGLIFAVWTFANLFPRARSTHNWYLETFPDYPKKRKALIPFIY